MYTEYSWESFDRKSEELNIVAGEVVMSEHH